MFVTDIGEGVGNMNKRTEKKKKTYYEYIHRKC